MGVFSNWSILFSIVDEILYILNGAIRLNNSVSSEVVVLPYNKAMLSPTLQASFQDSQTGTGDYR